MDLKSAINFFMKNKLIIQVKRYKNYITMKKY